MSGLQELIKKLCPEGVPRYTLGEIGSFYGGLSGKNKNDFVDGNAAYITYMNIYQNPATDLHIEDRVKMDPSEKQNQVHQGDILFTGSSETKEECAISSVVICEPKEPVYLNSFCFGFRLNDTGIFLPEFAQHLFRTSQIRTELQKTASGVTRYNVSKEKMAKVSVPVPPIPVQREIVSILEEIVNNSNQLISELHMQLEARRIQHAYYREAVFDKFQGTPYVIKDICIKTCSGGTPKTSHTEYYGGEIPWLRTQEIDWKDIYDTGVKITEEGLRNSSAKMIPADCVVVAMYGATAGKVAINRIPITTNQACCNLQINTKITTPEYVFFWLLKDYKKLKGLGRGSQDNLNADMIKNFQISIPSLDVQQEIISLVQELECYYNELEHELEQTIEFRGQQLTYFADRLLSFSV